MRPASSGARRSGARRAGKPDTQTDQNSQNLRSKASVSGSVAALTFGLVYPWGVSDMMEGGSWGPNGGADDPQDVLCAYPHLFTVDCVIKEILMNNQTGALAPGTKYKLGIYSNYGQSVPYPFTKLAEWAEQAPLQNAIALTTWDNLNMSVSAGTMLWIVQTCDSASAGAGWNLASIGTASRMQIGLADTMNDNPISGWQVARVYNGALPAQFPQTPPTPLTSSHQMPAFLMRFR